MWKYLYTLTAVMSFFILSCQRNVSMQTKNMNDRETNSTANSKQESVENSRTVNQQAKDHLNEGLKYKLSGENEKAVEEFKRSIEAGNDDKEIYRQIAELYITLKRFEDAENYFRKVSEKDSKDMRVHSELAGVLVWNLNKYDEGLKEALLAKRIDTSDTSYVMEMTIGKAYDGLGEYENAIKHYKIFLKGSSFIPDSINYKDTKKRVEELEKVIQQK